MFTGIVEEVGDGRGARTRRADVLRGAHRARARWLAGLPRGGSIAVNGCCLTAVEVDATAFTCELTARDPGPDGLRRRLRPGRARSTWSGRCAPTGGSTATSSRGTWTAWARSLRLRRAGERRGAAWSSRRPSSSAIWSRRDRWRWTASRSPWPRSRAGAFTVALIPYTLERTNLARRAPGRPGEPGGGRDRQVRRAAASQRASARARNDHEKPDAVQHHPRSHRGHPPGPDGRRRGRRGPRERGRPHASPPRRSRPTSSTSWPATAAGSSACP